MHPKDAAVVITAALAQAASAALNESCSWWWLEGQVTLKGDCVDSTNTNRHRIVSNLDLNDCIGVDPTANAMIWKHDGQAFHTLCNECSIQNCEYIMQCVCTNPLTGGKTGSSVNLNDGIWVNGQGWLSC